MRRPRSERRKEAETRQAERAKRSPQEQLTVLDGRPGESRKERARLCASSSCDSRWFSFYARCYAHEGTMELSPDEVFSWYVLGTLALAHLAVILYDNWFW